MSEFTAIEAFLPEHYVGRYRLISTLSSGNPVQAFLAKDTFFDRHVAVLACGANPFAEWMIDETKVRARFQHSGLVPIYDAAQGKEGYWFVVSKLCDGQDLYSALRRDGPLALRAVALIVAQVAETLHALHERGVIHGDVKPRNIKLDDGRPLLDGMLGVLGQDKSDGVIGTAGYVSPEIWRAGIKSADRRSDIFSLGVTLYELLTGKRPFEGFGRSEALRCIMEQSPLPPCQLRQDIPMELETICLKAIEKNPEDRFKNACEMAEQLRQFVHQR